MSRSFDGLDDVVLAIDAATSADEALDALVGHLRDRFELNAVSLISFDGERVIIAATWSAVPSFFASGIEINTTQSPQIASIVATVRRGTVLAGKVSDLDLGLLGDLLGLEGLASFAVVPLLPDQTTGGVIGLLSSEHDGLGLRDIPFLAAIGKGVERVLAPLIETALARLP